MILFLSQSYGAFAIALGFSVALTTAGSLDCGIPSPWTFNSTNHSNQTIGDHSFLVHIPAGYNASAAHALVLSYHGNNDTEVHQELISGFSEEGILINGKGIIAVYPLGMFGPSHNGVLHERTWEGAPYAEPGVDNIGFTNLILDLVQENLCVDINRIYAAGKSNGGGFVNLLACTSTIASRIAAFSPISTVLYAGTKAFSGCEPRRTIPLLNYHGLADHTIPFSGQMADKEGDTAYAMPNITQYREAWALCNGCQSTIETLLTHPHTNTTLKEWDCSPTDANTVVRGYTVTRLGHS
ncbi:carbohydrate esterase family 1 protein [Ramaria rubella]|nr:carbohydrate esterase family 1 protein [Ramaria rubella]